MCPVAQERILSEAPENFFVMPLHFFGSRSTVGRFGERFRDGQHNLVGLLFAVFVCPRVQLFVIVGARAPVLYGVGATATYIQKQRKWLATRQQSCRQELY